MMSLGADKQYRLVFARSTDSVEAAPGLIVVAPSSDEWNDFGFQLRAKFKIVPRLTAKIAPYAIDDFGELDGLLAFTEARRRLSDVRMLREMLDEEDSSLLEENRVPSFFTMLPDMQGYRNLVGTLGPDEANIVLRCLHDIVEAENGLRTPAWLQSARDSRVFQGAFLRTSEAYFAWKNASMILHGVEFEEVGRLSEILRISFHLAGRPNEHELEFQFSIHEDVLPKRFAVVIGKNGVGKSQTLGRIVEAAMRGTGALTDGAGVRPSFNRILAFQPSAHAASVFPQERRKKAKTWYRRFTLGGPSLGRRRQTSSDLIVQLARTPEQIGGVGRFEIFLRALLAIEGSAELALPMRSRENGFVPIQELLEGGEQDRLDCFASIDPKEEVVRVIDERPFSLSSGEASFVRFAALASLYIENSTLLLFDEPETHLHPNFISRFVVLLDNLLKQTGSAAIIATHSVYFVREAFEDQVHVLRSGGDRQISVEQPTLKTFGADVGAISYFVFGEDEPSWLARGVEKQIAQTSKTWEDAYETYKDDLSLELLGEIRATIEDRAGESDPK